MSALHGALQVVDPGDVDEVFAQQVVHNETRYALHVLHPDLEHPIEPAQQRLLIFHHVFVVVLDDTILTQQQFLLALFQSLKHEALVIRKEEEAGRLARAREEVVDGLNVVQWRKRLKQLVLIHVEPPSDLLENARRILYYSQLLCHLCRTHLVNAQVIVLLHELAQIYDMLSFFSLNRI